MRVLLGLRQPELPQPLARDPGAERVGDVLGREHRRHQPVERVGVLAPCRAPPPRPAARRPRSRRTPDRPAPPRICRARSARKLAKKSPSPSSRAGVVADHGRGDELVGLAARVGRRDRLARARGARALAAQDRRGRQRHPLPALVPVHGVEPPRHRRDPRPRRQRRLERGDLRLRRLRRHVAAVEEGVHRHRHARPPTIAAAAAAMWRWCACTPPGEASPARCAVPPRALHRRDEARQRRVRGEAAVGDRRCRCAAGPSRPPGRRRCWCARPRSCPSAPRAARPPARARRASRAGRSPRSGRSSASRASATAFASREGLRPQPSRMQRTTGRMATSRDRTRQHYCAAGRLANPQARKVNARAIGGRLAPVPSSGNGEPHAAPSPTVPPRPRSGRSTTCSMRSRTRSTWRTRASTTSSTRSTISWTICSTPTRKTRRRPARCDPVLPRRRRRRRGLRPAADEPYGDFDGAALFGGDGDDTADRQRGSDLLLGGNDDDRIGGGAAATCCSATRGADVDQRRQWQRHPRRGLRRRRCSDGSRARHDLRRQRQDDVIGGTART